VPDVPRAVVGAGALAAVHTLSPRLTDTEMASRTHGGSLQGRASSKP
jgi:hypothetical protein